MNLRYRINVGKDLRTVTYGFLPHTKQVNSEFKTHFTCCYFSLAGLAALIFFINVNSKVFKGLNFKDLESLILSEKEGVRGFGVSYKTYAIMGFVRFF